MNSRHKEACTALLHAGSKGGIGRRFSRVVKRGKIKSKSSGIQKNLDYLEKSVLKLQFLPL